MVYLRSLRSWLCIWCYPSPPHFKCKHVCLQVSFKTPSSGNRLTSGSLAGKEKSLIAAQEEKYCVIENSKV